MKKIQKKLVLKKKTISQLSENAISPDKLIKVQGGSVTGCGTRFRCVTANCYSTHGGGPCS